MSYARTLIGLSAVAAIAVNGVKISFRDEKKVGYTVYCDSATEIVPTCVDFIQEVLEQGLVTKASQSNADDTSQNVGQYQCTQINEDDDGHEREQQNNILVTQAAGPLTGHSRDMLQLLARYQNTCDTATAAQAADEQASFTNTKSFYGVMCILSAILSIYYLVSPYISQTEQPIAARRGP